MTNTQCLEYQMTRLLPSKTPTPSVILGRFAVLFVTCKFKEHSFITRKFADHARNTVRLYACPSRIPFSVPCKLVLQTGVKGLHARYLTHVDSFVPQLLYSRHQFHVRHLQRGCFRDHLVSCKQLRTCEVVRCFCVMISTCTISRQHRRVNAKTRQAPFQANSMEQSPFWKANRSSASQEIPAFCET
jgi:hypothetical protein